MSYTLQTLKNIEEKLFIRRDIRIGELKKLEEKIEKNIEKILREISKSFYNISYEELIKIGEKFQKPIYSYFGYNEQIQVPNIEFLALEVLEDLVNDKSCQKYIPHTFYESNFFASSHSDFLKPKFLIENEKELVKIVEKKLSSEDLNKFQKYSIGDVTLNLVKNIKLKDFYNDILTKNGYEILDASEKIKDLSYDLLENNYTPRSIYLKEDLIINKWDLVDFENKNYEANLGTKRNPRIFYKNLKEIKEEIEKNKYKYYRVDAKDYYPLYLLFPIHSKYIVASHVDWIEKENNLNFVREHYNTILNAYEKENIKTPLKLILIQSPSSTGINYTDYPKLTKNLHKFFGNKIKTNEINTALDEYVINIYIRERELKEKLKEHIYKSFLENINKSRNDLTFIEVFKNVYKSIFEYLEKKFKDD